MGRTKETSQGIKTPNTIATFDSSLNIHHNKKGNKRETSKITNKEHKQII